MINCDYKTYYVDIGKLWNLDNARIWTLEVPSKVTMQKQNAESLEQTDATPRTSNPTVERMRDETLKNLEPNLPIVMVHGFGSGVAMWSLNVDELSQHGKRSIYALDVLGFGKSSRPNIEIKIPNKQNLNAAEKKKAEAEMMEEYMVESIEKWRQSIGGPLAGRFIILGHSFGGYLSLAYALRYPKNVAHVILADPWGLAPENHEQFTSQYNNRQAPFLVRCIAKFLFEISTPLVLFRALGPFSLPLINRTRADLKQKFRQNYQPKMIEPRPDTIQNNDTVTSTETPGNFVDYVFHCNAQLPPSGEIAFQNLCTATAHARLPMLERILSMKSHINLTFIYGSRSWVDRQSAFQAKYLLATSETSRTPNVIEDIIARAAAAVEAANRGEHYEDGGSERVSIHILQEAGHHVYVDRVEDFNKLVLQTCLEVDARLPEGEDGIEHKGLKRSRESDSSLARNVKEKSKLDVTPNLLVDPVQ